MEGKSRPVRVTAIASTGVATGKYQIDTEDTITLAVQWLNNGECMYVYNKEEEEEEDVSNLSSFFY